jgi:CRP/FNR family cyclic AMP-dependent transcriptional regulator
MRGERFVIRIPDMADSGLTRVLDEDPDLGEMLDSPRLELARERALAGVLEFGSSPTASWPDGLRVAIGLLMLDGVVIRRVEIDGRVGAEMLGRGDLLRPWEDDRAVASIPRSAEWRALSRCRTALLDVDFARRIEPFPEIYERLLGRAVTRSRNAAISIAILHQPRVERRLHMFLWYLADRWGRVRPDGVLVPVNLTHATLSELVAARRQTVSSALRALERDGLVEQLADGLLLVGSPPGSAGPAGPA